MSDIDQAVDRLLRTAAMMGVPAPLNPARDAEIDAVRAAVAPLRVPDDLERLWRRLQEGPPQMVDRLDLMPVSQVLEFRGIHDWPKALLTMAYASHWFHFVELNDPDGTGGGTVWEGAYGDDDIKEVAPSLPDLIDAVAAAWEDGLAPPYEVGGFRVVNWDDEGWERRKAELWPDRRSVPARIVRWPARWLEIQGLDLGDARARGATTTIAALRELGDAWTDTATVSGSIRGLSGSMQGSGGSLDDGTGQLFVFVSPGADPFQLLQNGRLVELDLRPFGDGVEVGSGFRREGFEAVATAVRRDDVGPCWRR
jgi:hypothetical protein